MESFQDRLVFRSRWLSFLLPNDQLEPGGGVLTILAADMASLEKTGAVVGWGVNIETEFGTLWCWGPAVPAAVSGLDPRPPSTGAEA